MKRVLLWSVALLVCLSSVTPQRAQASDCDSDLEGFGDAMQIALPATGKD